MTENANQKGAQQKIETPSEAYGSGSASGFLSENAKNPKDGSDWLGGPQNGDETPRKAARNPQTGDIQKPTEADGNVQGVDTQAGTQAKGEYTKHRFNETPGNGGNGGNGGNASGTGSGGNGDATSVGSASTPGRPGH
jgi:hypothetical protein